MSSSSHSSIVLPSQFAATRWSIVLAAGNWRANPSAHRAMGELAGMYWFPLYAYLRRQGNSPPQAEDLVQGFLVHLLDHDALASVDRSKGKFRSFLLASLKNFVLNEWDKNQAKKRGGGSELVSLDVLGAESRYLAEPADLMTPERVFERRWALELLDHVLIRLRAEYAEHGQSAIFAALEHSLVQVEPLRAAQIAATLGMTEGAVKVASHRLRGRYRNLLRDEIAQTVAAPELVDEEIQQLLKSL